MTAPVENSELVRLMRSGIFIPVNRSCTLRHFLEDILGFPRDYVENRIQTILLNGLAADGLDASRLSAQTRLALSAAMPGLAGATLRRDGGFKNLRRDISLNDAGAAQAPDEEKAFWVELRLFNDIAAEQAAHLFKRGFAVPAAGLAAGLRGRAGPLPANAPAPPENTEPVWLQKE